MTQTAAFSFELILGSYRRMKAPQNELSYPMYVEHDTNRVY